MLENLLGTPPNPPPPDVDPIEPDEVAKEVESLREQIDRLGSVNLDAIDEERRLFYVAVTRAKWRLFVVRSNTRQRWGRVEERHPSRFLGEIDENLLNEIDGACTEPVEDPVADKYLDKLKALFEKKR